MTMIVPHLRLQAGDPTPSQPENVRPTINHTPISQEQQISKHHQQLPWINFSHYQTRQIPRHYMRHVGSVCAFTLHTSTYLCIHAHRPPRMHPLPYLVSNSHVRNMLPLCTLSCHVSTLMFSMHQPRIIGQHTTVHIHYM